MLLILNWQIFFLVLFANGDYNTNIFCTLDKRREIFCETFVNCFSRSTRYSIIKNETIFHELYDLTKLVASDKLSLLHVPKIGFLSLIMFLSYDQKMVQCQ